MCIVVRLDIAYEGTRFHGFGIQPNVPTVQRELQTALLRILGEVVRVTPAGRTDAGVHARGQVVSFTCQRHFDPGRLSRALNACLPADIAVLSADRASDDFDARRSAVRRHYRYSIWNDRTPNPWTRRTALHVPHGLHVQAMQRGADLLTGRHDFSSFIGRMAQETRPRSPLRTLTEARWTQDDGHLHFDCAADAFGRHMVRNIVGTLLQVGSSRAEPEAVREILASRDRSAAGPTAASHGLTLMKVDYETGRSSPVPVRENRSC